MSRGFLAGAIWGVVVSGLGAGALSVAMGPPQAPLTPTPATPPAEAQAEAAPAPESVAEAPAAPESVSEAPVPERAEAAPEPAAEASESEGATAEPEEVAAEPEMPEIDETAPQTTTELETPVAPETPGVDAPEGGAVAVESPPRNEALAAVPEAPEAEAVPSLPTEAANPPLPKPFETPAEAEAAEAPAEEETAPAEVAVLPQAAPEAPAPLVRPGLGNPAGSLLDRDDAVPTGRLPSIGAPETPATDGAQESAPLVRFAADAAVPEGEPRMAIVLIDDGAGPLGPDTVGEFPFPVSFAIASSHPDAAATAAAYRARGFEVLAMAGVPEAAQATDVEVALEGALGAVPEAIGVLEDPGQGLQGARAISDQAAQFLLASGHGLVMLPKGLNTGQALALRDGVPSATVFRDFDGEGQDPRVMRRFLDQAAFKARQEGAVVMLGRLRADTVSALLLWGLQDRANSVALVPVSVILRESLDDR
ncbi:divergent polysaccharide deacetylase family protein [Salipiger sp. P9]|uniref:divergent polysaccharide deacetylase family protein n=1 Tax=Salipiger pentaromativorans TaxID=2943193 RepID=UPI00215872B0|nr:divergent polysaccharide deacetylase family protein [Salipiger pentaromativorans]MCR8547333.1 divergent polysaccharide deacetylase family protein [Salipiger pentaromativorans]